MSEYESEYETPPFTIIEQRAVGRKVITTAVFAGEFAEFEADAQLRMDLKAALVPLSERFDEVIKSFDE